MSVFVSKTVNLPQAVVKFLVQEESDDESAKDYRILGGVLSATDYAWLSRGPHLEIINTKSGNKMGAWTFGSVLKDFDTEVVCVDEIQRPYGSLPLLAVGIDCAFSGSMICVFDFITSRIIRAIQIPDKITSLQVIDAGYDVFTLPGPLRNFDGIIAVGTAGGNVFLIDICRQICDEALTVEGLGEIHDELNPCQLSNLTSKDVSKMDFHKEFAIRNSQHLAIHLNVIFDKSTDHFTLKGPKGDDRVHVNKEEVVVSSLCYCPQLGSLLIGYNFGAFQLYNLMNLILVYTSPVCEEHIPISHFAVQEPADDPRAFCYIWAVYSAGDEYQACLPLAVMYAFCYHTKEYHEGYGFLYQDFNYAAVHYQMELALPNHSKRLTKPQGGRCLRLSTMHQSPSHKDKLQIDPAEDNLTICVLVWSVWFNRADTETFVTVFDLNQWYKEQMPNTPDYKYSSTYMLQFCVSDVTVAVTNKEVPVLDISVIKDSLRQFQGTQRLEEHFCPNSLSFSLCSLRESDVIFIENHGVQKALLDKIKNEGPLCLIEPAEIYHQIIGLGLVPLFIDLPANSPISTSQQREIILGAALEHQLLGCLCRCASEWANGSFLAAGCTLDFLISWAYQRAATLKTNCDKFCVPLFDYSELRLDTNTNNLLNNCTRQLNKICCFYSFIMKRLVMFLPNHELVEEQYKQLQMVSVYFEVLQWLLNVGLLPECSLTAYPRSDDHDRVNAPYPAEALIDFYNHRRALLKILNEENFSSTNSVLFIDSLIDKECGGQTLQEHWRRDGGNGSYPPPSLQALLRTYLVDRPEVFYKHSIVLYVFLDLAMILDQDRYKTVVTHLIKFPAVFQVSPSVIKITQAFWQLDHGDYNTAMGLLLDPLVLSQDLKDWHHKVALRSLLLQKQHNFALLYLQVRKPPISDDEDVFTAISLYVANNMLDEAFYFEKHFSNSVDNTKFMLHLFNEATKNDKLKSVIYRALDSDQERFFLKYLLNSKQPSAEDLHVYYHILRSRYIEAFESHDRTVANQVEAQGLVGQQDAIPRDKLVYNLKKLLPNVNRNLLTVCSRERDHVWKQVARPTPMSVFSHNVDENVNYKSTLIYAALAKAKQTFDETIKNETMSGTEGTPFLRTPIVPKLTKRRSTFLIDPKIVEEYGPSPIKRLKLSPRQKLAPAKPSQLDTPVVRRRTPRIAGDIKELNSVTPQSILKVRSLITKETPSQFKDDIGAFENSIYTPVASSNKKSGLGLSPRKSLNRSNATVRFEGLRSLSSSFQSSGSERLSLTKDLSLLHQSSSSKNTSAEEDIFYSPETSIDESEIKGVNVEENETFVKDDEMKDDHTSIIARENEEDKTWIKDNENKKNDFIQERDETQQSEVETSKNSEIMSTEKLEEERKNGVDNVTKRRPVYTPKARRSYRGSSESVPVRTSPRLSKLSSSATESSSESPSDSPNTATKAVPALRGRKSLCRQVLETNALSRVFNSTSDSSRSTKSKESIEEINKTEENVEIVIESTSKYMDGEDTQKSSLINKHIVTTTSVVELSDTSIVSDTSNKSFVSSDLETTLDDSNRESYFNTSSILTKSILEMLKTPVKKTKVEIDKEISVETVEKEVAIDESVADEHSSLEHNQFNSYQETNLSESALQYMNSEIEKNAVVDNAMEVDVYEDLTGDETQKVDIYEEVSSDDNKDEEEPVYEDISRNNRTVDPQMNVFEISDDLSVNDGIAVEKEVSLEENDLCYGQSNTLENVMQESGITSGSPNVFERNVFFGSDSQDEIEENPDAPEKSNSENKTLDEVIEIGSSSDEQEATNISESSEETSENSSKQNTYLKNYSSDESSEDNSNQGSEDIKEQKRGTRKSHGFFHGDILYGNDSPVIDRTVKSEEELAEDNVGTEDEEKVSTPEYRKSFGLFHGDIIFSNESSSSISDLAEKEPEVNQVIEEQCEENVDENKPPVLSSQRIQKETVEEISSRIQEENFKEIIEETNNATLFITEKLEEEKNKEIEANLTESILAEADEDGNSYMEPLEEIIELQRDNIERKCEDETVSEDPKPNFEAGKVVQEDNFVEKPETVAEMIVEEKYQNEDVPMETIESNVEAKTVSRTVVEESNQDDDVAMENCESTVSNAIVGEKSNLPENQPASQNVESKIEVETDAAIMKEDNLVENKETEKVVDAKANRVEGAAFSNNRLGNSNRETSNILKFSPAEVVSQKSLDITTSREVEDTLGVVEPKSRSPSISSNTSVKKPKKTRHQDEETLTPRRRSTRLSVTSQEPSISDSISKSDTLRNKTLRARASSTEAANATKKPTRRTRSASVDESKTTKRVKRDLTDLPEIAEESNKFDEVSKSTIEDYSMTRRMTRRQATMLHKTFELSSLDPIVLLDKGPFEGTPDPEEKRVYETSPTNSTATNVSVARRLRSSSHASDVSVGSDITELLKSPAKGVRRRLRKSVDEISNVSGKSNQSAPPIRGKTKKDTSDSEDVQLKARTTRSKAKSVSSDVLDVASTSRTGRRKATSSFSTLPEIQEDTGDGAKATASKRKTRKGSSQK